VLYPLVKPPQVRPACCCGVKTIPGWNYVTNAGIASLKIGRGRQQTPVNPKVRDHRDHLPRWIGWIHLAISERKDVDLYRGILDTKQQRLCKQESWNGLEMAFMIFGHLQEQRNQNGHLQRAVMLRSQLDNLGSHIPKSWWARRRPQSRVKCV